VRQLEDALQVSHSRQSIEPHPLLTEELLKLKKPLEKGNESENAQSTGANFREHIGKGTGESELDSADELIDKAGSLSLRPGRDNWHGASANSYALMKVFEPIVTALKSKLKTLFTERRL